MDSMWLMRKLTSCSFFQHFQQSGKSDHFWLSWILCFPLSCHHEAFGLLEFWQTSHTKQGSFVQQDRGSRDASSKCFSIYQIGIVEGGLETESQQGKPIAF